MEFKVKPTEAHGRDGRDRVVIYAEDEQGGVITHQLPCNEIDAFARALIEWQSPKEQRRGAVLLYRTGEGWSWRAFGRETLEGPWDTQEEARVSLSECEFVEMQESDFFSFATVGEEEENQDDESN